MRKKIIQNIEKIEIHQSKNRAIATIALLFCISFILFYSYFLFIPWKTISNPGSVPITIEKGMSPKDISDSLFVNGIIRSSEQFLVAAKLLGVSRKLQAGEYIFKRKINNNYRVLSKLYRGETMLKKVTFPEGLRAEKIASIFFQNMKVDSAEFMYDLRDTLLIRQLGLDVNFLEGYLYPDTYFFSFKMTPEEMIRTMVSQFKKIFTYQMAERAKKIGMSVHEVVILASIVEGEAVLDSERKSIAALYLNRLKRHMRLQADPTIQYIIDDGPRRLFNKDLKIKSPYNTYMYTGLPPGPVNNPGLASIMAVLYPDSVNYLYMVANGDGTHTFSSTLSDHLDAKRHLDRIRKKVIYNSR
jgi:UPF0755 protein